jgi:hypothetical protein
MLRYGKLLCHETVGCVQRTTSARRCVSRTLLCCSIAVAVLAGCGGDKGPERVVVTGTVTYNGKPIPTGTVQFTPVQTSLVPAAGADITDGKYRADIHGGVPVGTHNIAIEAYRPVKGPRGSAHENGLQQYIPRKYNADSRMQITIAPGSREIAKNFDLTD